MSNYIISDRPVIIIHRWKLNLSQMICYWMNLIVSHKMIIQLWIVMLHLYSSTCFFFLCFRPSSVYQIQLWMFWLHFSQCFLKPFPKPFQLCLCLFCLNFLLLSVLLVLLLATHNAILKSLLSNLPFYIPVERMYY